MRFRMEIIMSVIIENETDVVYNFDHEELIERVVNQCLDFIECPYEACVSITLVDEEAIRAINKDTRDIDKVTDVLSFPMIDYETRGDFSKLEDNLEDYFDPDSGELVLGDIVLCVQRIESQAKEYGHSNIREMAFLTAHSMFHLFGYDHMEEEERIEMEELQEQVLSQLDITRD